VCPAAELYQGRAFAEAKNIAMELSADLYIASAGLGLISAEDAVPSYSLTVVGESADNVLRRCVGEAPSAEFWWRNINKRLHIQSFTTRVARSPHDFWLIAVPATYYGMIRDDLMRLTDKDLARIRLFGPRVLTTSTDIVLHKTLIALDDRLDGPDSNIRGTRSDFAQRAMAFFVRNVLTRNPNQDVVSHRQATSKLLRQMDWPSVAPRRSASTDEEIFKKLDLCWPKAKGQSTKLLRILRDDLLIACEEGRFRRLYRSVAAHRGVR
jgi:hypothetical protein